MRYLVLLWVAVISMSTPRLASATSCAPPDYDASFESADVVFIGTADKVVPTNVVVVAHFSVARVFKGKLPAQVRVQGGGMPGAHFEPKRRYLVYAGLMVDKASRVHAQLHAHLCSGTVETDFAPAWVERLGAGRPPQAGPIVAGAASDPVPSNPVSGDPPPEAPVPEQPATPPLTGEPEPEAPLEPEPPHAAPGTDNPAQVAPTASRTGCAGCAVGDADHGSRPRWLLSGRTNRATRFGVVSAPATGLRTGDFARRVESPRQEQLELVSVAE
jgi:hypothetical protein